MLPENKLTTIIIDTENYNLGLNALNNSVRSFPTKEVIVFSDQPKKWNGYDCKVINKITNLDEYNNIVLNDIIECINTEFVLIIQYDGFVVNPEKFIPEFLNCDYIGAPWETFNYRKVGNGGFSLRSKRLLSAAKEYAYSRPYEQPEDYFICKDIGELLEGRYGIKFAPYAMAQKFSTEETNVATIPFGFHGVAYLPFVYRNNLDYLLKNLNPRVFKDWRYQALSKSFKTLGNNQLIKLEQFVLRKSLT